MNSAGPGSEGPHGLVEADGNTAKNWEWEFIQIGS